MRKHNFISLTILLSVVFLLALMVALLTVTASASCESEIKPCNVDIGALTASLNIDSNGKTSCGSFVRARTSTNKVYLTMTLQRSSGSGWENVKTWSTSGTYSAALAEEKYVVSGYTYRVKVTASAYTSSGTFVEQLTIYSGERSY